MLCSHEKSGDGCKQTGFVQCAWTNEFRWKARAVDRALNNTKYASIDVRRLAITPGSTPPGNQARLSLCANEVRHGN